MPSTFSFGARVFPPVRGLSFLLGFDIGLSGTSTFVRELAPNKPYDVLIAVSYATDVREPPPRRAQRRGRARGAEARAARAARAAAA